MARYEEVLEREIKRMERKADRYKKRALTIDRDAKNDEGELLRDVYIEKFQAYSELVSKLKST